MVLGAGRGPLVEATLKAAERAEALRFGPCGTGGPSLRMKAGPQKVD